MTPPNKLLISPRENGFAVCYAGAGWQQKDSLPNLDEVRAIQKREAIPSSQVFIDAGFLGLKVNAACELWGWRRVFSWMPERAEIDAATKDIPFA
jgi:hypothetical protein